MNSRDPWSVIATDAFGNIVHPRPRYGHPFYTEVPSWIHDGDRNDTTRQLFEGAFISGEPVVSKAEAGGTVAGWVDIIGANMTNIIGAELTALSAPGAFYGRYAYPYYGPRPYGGVFFGADAPPAVAPPMVVPAPGTLLAPAELPRRTGLLAEVAPIVAPGTGGITVKKEFDDKQVLHVEICVDGKCYKTSMDLAPAIAMVMQKLAQWHQGIHQDMQAPSELPSTVVSTIENAISAAGDEMADVMVGHHVAVMTSGWLSDIGGAIGSAMRKLQPVISTVATKVAEAYGGPAAGAAAGALAPMITNLQANALDPKGDPKKKAAAQQALQQINQAAATDPAAAQALAAANLAVKNTTVAYYVKDTAQQAAAGNPTAQKDISNLVQAAEAGDPAAKSTFDVLAQTFAQEMMKSETGAKLWEKVTGRGPGTVSPGMAAPKMASPGVSGWYDVVGGTVIVGSFWSKVKNGLLTVTLTKATNQFIKDNKLEPYVKLAATAVATAYGGPAAGAAAGALSGPIMSLGVEDKKQADAAQKSVEGVKEMAQQTDPQLAPAVDIAKAAIDQTATAYQVSQMVKDAKAGNPEAQKALADLQAAASRGDQNAAAALQAAAVLDRALGRDQEQQNAPGPAVGQWYDIADTVIRMAGTTSTSVGCPPYGPAVAGWYDIIGAAIDDTREKARAHAVTKPGTAAGVLITVDGQLHGRGFRNLDDAVSWLDHITRNRGSFTYAAAYEKDADGAAYIQAEEMGRTSQPTPAPTPIPRDHPAMAGW